MPTITTPMPPPYAFRPEQLKRLRELGCVPFATNGHAGALRVSVAVYEQLIAEGVLGEDDRCELLDGEVVSKMPIGDPHVIAVNRLNRHLTRLLLDRATVSVQNPIVLPQSEPEPDLVVAFDIGPDYAGGRPTPGQVYLVVEVASSSLEFDRDIKGPLYAASGVPEYWIVDLNAEQLLVFREPRPDGTWGCEQLYQRGETVEVSTMPGVRVGVDEILGGSPSTPA